VNLLRYVRRAAYRWSATADNGVCAPLHDRRAREFDKFVAARRRILRQTGKEDAPIRRQWDKRDRRGRHLSPLVQIECQLVAMTLLTNQHDIIDFLFQADSLFPFSFPFMPPFLFVQAVNGAS